MQKHITDYDDYKKYLRMRINLDTATKGYQSRLAKAAGCQRSYLSQVLSGSSHLTMEHGIGIANFWSLTKVETSYWLDLLALCRSGSIELSNFYANRLAASRSAAKEISTRLNSVKPQSEVDLARYFSSWYWSAIHVCLGLKKIESVDEIAQYLGIKKELALYVLEELEKMGLVSNSNGKWQGCKDNIHLPSDSPLVDLHHNSWRRFVLERGSTHSDDLRFSAVISLSKKDRLALRHLVLDFLEVCSKKIAESEEETLQLLAIDYLSI